MYKKLKLFFKVAELILTLCTSIMFSVASGSDSSISKYYLVKGTMIAFFLVTMITITGYYYKQHLERRLEIIFTVVGFFLFEIIGIEILSVSRQENDKIYAIMRLLAGMLGLFNGLVFFTDHIVALNSHADETAQS